LKIIPAPRSIKFVTSDNPSVFATGGVLPQNGKPFLQVIFTPLDPNHMAVAFDRRYLSIRRQEATLADAAAFNLIQTKAAETCIYKSSSVTDSDMLALKTIFDKKMKPVCEVTEEG
jgi:hypothetical protein